MHCRDTCGNFSREKEASAQVGQVGHTRGSFRRAKYMTGARKAVAGTPATLGRFRRNQLLMGLGVGRWQLEG